MEAHVADFTVKVAASLRLPKICSIWSTQITLLSIRTQDFVGTRISIRRMRLYNPTTTVEWLARGLHARSQKLPPGNEAPHYLIRDRDRAYGATFSRRLRAMGIPQKILGSPSR